jgi:hypothetical protein
MDILIGAICLIGYVFAIFSKKLPRLGIILGFAAISSPLIVYLKYSKEIFEPEASGWGGLLVIGFYIFAAIVFILGLVLLLSSWKRMDSPEYRASRANVNASNESGKL